MSLQAARNLVRIATVAVCAAAGCGRSEDASTAGDRTKPSPQETSTSVAPEASSAVEESDQAAVSDRVDGIDWKAKREEMVRRQMELRDIDNERVLTAMRTVPRHLFVPAGERSESYADRPLPIKHGQTISQPYIVALMTQWARPKPESRALDIGTGTGYQAAVLAELVKEVYSIEILCPLADSARQRLEQFGCRNVTVRCADGYQGWPEHAPFDVIIVAAAPNHIPQPLVEQLAPGGRLVIPVGGGIQALTVVEKQSDGSLRKFTVSAVRFVPMTGEAEDHR